MSDKKLVDDVEQTVKYQIKKIEQIFGARQVTNHQYLTEFLNPSKGIDENNSVLNQALSDSLLNSMASLVDYYSVCCMLKLGVPEARVRKVQYRSLNNAYLIEKSSLTKSEKDLATIGTIIERYKSELVSNAKLKKLNGNDYWLGFLGRAISHTLKEYGALESSDFKLSFDEEADRLSVDPKIERYYEYMQPFFCNPAMTTGLKHSIYIDINNFLKHNAVPFLSTKIEQFDGEGRIFSYFEIKNKYGEFLREGILKDLLSCDFEELRSILDEKKTKLNDWDDLCSLEREWGVGRVLTVDRINDYISSDNEFLYFFVDSVLLAKSKNAILVDAEKSFLTVLRELKSIVERGLELFKD
ncbi:hypothetical protein V0R52_08900 [Pseudomonas asiatica]|uniref:hypothetical protein n=1 Tax=Pseudomonas asiatica TaxID=2219225 RepID=UPI002E7BB15A|nr:hypothetical protein [Pseudomonas asiatica]MEE1916509.1 hypothetical protein [Pseudomonas asiatica]